MTNAILKTHPENVPKNAIFIPGNVPSLKNSRRITSTGRSIASDLVVNYVADSGPYWILRRQKFLDMLKGKMKPYNIHFKFIRSSRKAFDYHNAIQILADSMSTENINRQSKNPIVLKYAWLEDDNASVMKPIFEDFTVDPEKPGVYIWVS
jgi:hypothetical protein